MSKKILIVDDEADTNAALLGALESGFKADSNVYPSHRFGSSLTKRIDEIMNGVTTIQIRSK
jgi:hypothetical protein